MNIRSANGDRATSNAAAALEEFRAEVRRLLAEIAPGKGGPDDFDHNYRHGVITEDEYLAASKRWQATLAERGWAGLTWPREYGGQGRTPVEAAVFADETAAYGVSDFAFAVGLRMAGPTLIAHGSAEQQQRFLRPMLTGEEVWCQLFSEPGAGSDLANVSARAVRDGDEWVVTGQKVWTSKATFADYAVLLARTDPDVPKHRGLTYFICDMRAPGVHVVPIKQMNGLRLFSEVYLDAVRVPANRVVGDVNGGWRVAMTTLASERQMLGEGGGSSRLPPFAQLVDLAAAGGRVGDRDVRQQLAGAYIRGEINRLIAQRLRDSAGSGTVWEAGPNVLKLATTRHLRLTGDFALSLLGAAGMVRDAAGADGDDAWVSLVLTAPSSRLAGGTDEIQRNLIGERVLGLPSEPRVDRDVPFRDLPH